MSIAGWQTKAIGTGRHLRLLAQLAALHPAASATSGGKLVDQSQKKENNDDDAAGRDLQRETGRLPVALDQLFTEFTYLLAMGRHRLVKHPERKDAVKQPCASATRLRQDLITATLMLLATMSLLSFLKAIFFGIEPTIKSTDPPGPDYLAPERAASGIPSVFFVSACSACGLSVFS